MRAYEFLTEKQLDEINRRDFLRKAGIAAMYTGLGIAAVDQGAEAAEPAQNDGALNFSVPYSEAIVRIQDGIARDYHSKGALGLDYNVVSTIRQDKARFEIFYNHLGKPRPHSNVYVYDRGENTEIKFEDAPDRPKRFRIGKHLERLENNINKWLSTAVKDDF